MMLSASGGSDRPQVTLVPLKLSPFAVNFERSHTWTTPEPALLAVDPAHVTLIETFAPMVRVVSVEHCPPS
jgi:hypothetical protein